MITQDAIQKNFPSLAEKTYLNTAAEGIPPLSVGEALQAYWNDKLSGMDGREAHFAREAEAREAAATLVGLSAEEIGFCSCSAEAYNLLASALNLKESDEVVINDLDFPSGATPWLSAVQKPQMRLWQSKSGVLNLDDLVPLLNESTRLVQVSLVSFYNGWRLPWKPFIQCIRQSAPNALVSVDMTQAIGRCVIDCEGADILISSTHKWILGIHGGCIVGIPKASAEKLTTRSGGWYHIKNAFDTDRFERTEIKPGAPSYGVGMPSFAPIYALNAGMRYLLSVGVDRIAAYADKLISAAYEGILSKGIEPMAPYNPACTSGIIAFRHERAAAVQESLRKENIHVMYHAGRLRIACHGYNTMEDVQRFLTILNKVI